MRNCTARESGRAAGIHRGHRTGGHRGRNAIAVTHRGQLGQDAHRDLRRRACAVLQPDRAMQPLELALVHAEVCTASQYGIGDGYHGKRTASGERFNTHALTAAHKTKGFGSHATVTNQANGRSVSVRITDRGPFVRGRCIDLSYAAANAIGMGGTAKVIVQ